MVHRNRKQQRLGVDPLQLDVVTDRRRPQHTEVKGAGAQSLALVGSQHVGPNLQRDAGQFALDDPGDAGEMRERRGSGQPEPDQAATACGDPAGTPHGAVHTREDAGGFGLQELTRSGQRYLPGGAGEQRGAQLGLQLPDRVRQRRLCDVQLLRGLSEVTGLGYGNEIPQVTKLHGLSRAFLVGPQ